MPGCVKPLAIPAAVTVSPSLHVEPPPRAAAGTLDVRIASTARANREVPGGTADVVFNHHRTAPREVCGNCRRSADYQRIVLRAASVAGEEINGPISAKRTCRGNRVKLIQRHAECVGASLDTNVTR